MKFRAQVVIAILCTLLLSLSACGGASRTPGPQDEAAAQPEGGDSFGTYLGGGTPTSISEDSLKKDEFEELWALDCNDAPCFAVSWSPGGDRLAIGRVSGLVQILDPASGDELLSIDEGHGETIRGLAWSPTGEVLATLSPDGRIRLWNTLSGELIETMFVSQELFYSLSWSSQGQGLATLSSDTQLRIWDMGLSPVQAVMTMQVPEIGLKVKWSPDGTRLATLGVGSDVELWSFEDGAIQHVLPGEAEYAIEMAWSPDSLRIATGHDDGRIAIWRAGNGLRERELHKSSEPVFCLAWSPGGEYLIACNSLTMTIWNTVDWREIQGLEGLLGAPRNAAWSPDGSRLATIERGQGSSGNWLRVWSSPNP